MGCASYLTGCTTRGGNLRGDILYGPAVIHRCRGAWRQRSTVLGQFGPALGSGQAGAVLGCRGAEVVLDSCEVGLGLGCISFLNPACMHLLGTAMGD